MMRHTPSADTDLSISGHGGGTLGDNVDHAVPLLNCALEYQQRRLMQHAPVALVDIGPDNHIEQPVFVFERDEVNALGRRRGLMHDDQPRAPDAITVRSAV